jgi:thermostable 8-oxoguanine DNA glycosylase
MVDEIDWTIDATAKKIGKEMYERELINPKNSTQLFMAGVYSILAITENFTKQSNIYSELQSSGLNTINSVVEDRDNLNDLGRIVSLAKWPNKKEEWIQTLAKDWPKYKLNKKVNETLNCCKDDEYELRKNLVKDIGGFGWKTASLFMVKCGFNWVVPVDRWVMRYLKDEYNYGEGFNRYDIRGIEQDTFLDTEEIFSEKAIENGYTPAQFQAIVWSFSPTVKKEYEISLM